MAEPTGRSSAGHSGGGGHSGGYQAGVKVARVLRVQRADRVDRAGASFSAARSLQFCVEKIDGVNYKDVRLLQQFVAESGKDRANDA